MCVGMLTFAFMHLADTYSILFKSTLNSRYTVQVSVHIHTCTAYACVLCSVDILVIMNIKKVFPVFKGIIVC